jgi:hypothetical protein
LTRPRTRAGISSSIAELMAAYSPPMPKPVRKRKQAKASKAGGEARGHRGAHVDHQRDEEEALATEAVGETAEHQRAEHRAGDVERAGPADLHRAEAERVGALEHAAQRADDRDLEAVEHPGRAERKDDAPVPARPGERIEACGNVARSGHEARILDARARPGRHRANMAHPRTRSVAMPSANHDDTDVIDRAAGLAPGDALHAARRFRAKVVEATQASHDALLRQPVDGLSSEDRLRVAARVCTLAGATTLAATTKRSSPPHPGAMRRPRRRCRRCSTSRQR